MEIKHMAVRMKDTAVRMLTARRSRLASDFSFFAAACAGLALALFSCLIFFFSESVSLSAVFWIFLGAMIELRMNIQEEKAVRFASCVSLFQARP